MRGRTGRRRHVGWVVHLRVVEACIAALRADVGAAAHTCVRGCGRERRAEGRCVLVCSVGVVRVRRGPAHHAATPVAACLHAVCVVAVVAHEVHCRRHVVVLARSQRPLHKRKPRHLHFRVRTCRHQGKVHKHLLPDVACWLHDAGRHGSRGQRFVVVPEVRMVNSFVNERGGHT